MQKSPFLDSLSLHNYRNISSGVSFSNPTFIIGPNGSGKSNLFESINFFQSIMTESSPGSINKTIKNFGGISTIYSKYTTEEPIDFSYVVSLDSNEYLKLKIDFSVYFDAQSQNIYVFDESITLIPKDKSNTYIRGFSSSNINISPDGSIVEDKNIINLQKPSADLYLKRTKDKLLSNYLDQILIKLSECRFYNANNFSLNNIRSTPSTIDTNDLHMNSEGTNICNTYLNISNSLTHHEQYFEIEKFIRDSLDKHFLFLKTPIFDNRFVSLAYKRDNCEKAFNLETLPDGLIRMLIWTAILLHPSPPSLIVIDEPELGLHPKWMKPLMDLIWRAAEKTQVIVATHSPELLDYMDADEAGHVIVAEQDEKGLAQFNTLEPEALATWLKEYTLGDLYRLGRPEVGGWT